MLMYKTVEHEMKDLGTVAVVSSFWCASSSSSEDGIVNHN